MNDWEISLTRYCGTPWEEGGPGESSLVEDIRQALACIAARNKHLRELRAELDEIKSDVVEYVMDGLDFNWVEAVISIRHWRDLTEAAEAAEAAGAEGE